MAVLTLGAAMIFPAAVNGAAETLTPTLAVNEGKCFGKIEVHLPLARQYADPFDPKQVLVEGHFQGPDGKVVDVDGFLDQDYTSSHGTNDGWDHVTPKGSLYWAVRFSPALPGTYTWWVTCKDASGTAASAKKSLKITANPAATGFVRVAPNRTNFQFDNGAAFYAIGMCIAWPNWRGMYDFQRRFRLFSRNGGNAVRVFMSWPGMPLERARVPVGGLDPSKAIPYLRQYLFPELNERTHNGRQDPWGGLGKIDLAYAWRYDRLLDLARQNNLHLMLCLMIHADLVDDRPNGTWSLNPYNRANGGMLEHPLDFFSNPQAKAFFKRRLRYIVARWGWSSNVMSWELFNEVDNISYGHYPEQASAEWHREMARYLKRIDPCHHLVTTSTGARQYDSLFKIPEIDYAQAHYYNFVDSVPLVVFSNIQGVKRFGKPHLISEFGQEFLQKRFNGSTNYSDPKGVHIQTGLWASLASPGAGTVWPWYWDNYLEPLHLFGLYQPVAGFARGIPWNKMHWKALQLPPMHYLQPAATEQTLKLTPPRGCWVPAPFNRPNTLEIHPNGKVTPSLALLPLFLQQRGSRLHNPVTFQVNYRHSGRFQVHTLFYGHSGARLEVQMDKHPVLTREFAPGKGKHIQFVQAVSSIDVPAGRHEIRVNNAGHNFLAAEYSLTHYLDPAVPPVRCYGIRGDDRAAVLYLYNQDYTWYDLDKGQGIKPVAPFRMVVPGLKAGRYDVEIWAPSRGRCLTRQTLRATARGLALQFPEMTNDLAIKILPAH